MKGFIGRTNELATLKEVDQSQELEFVAVYGRRRVGKTLLVRTYFKDRIALQMTALAHNHSTKTQPQTPPHYLLI